MTFNLIKEQIAKSETERAIINLMSIVKSKFAEYQNDVLLLSGKFHTWKKEKILGIGDNEQKEWNKINYSILQLISLIEYEEEITKVTEKELVGYILVRYWSNEKWKDDYTINTDENENIKEVNELEKGKKYIVKYSYGANLRAYLPPKEGYSNRTIKETKLICNLPQCTKIEIIEPIYQFSENDYWAKIEVMKKENSSEQSI